MTVGKGNKASRIPHFFRLRRRLCHAPGVLLWVTVLTGALYLYQRQELGLRIKGYATGIDHLVAAEGPGRLKGLLVDLGESVKPGMIIARLDSRVLQLRLTQARLELGRLRQEMQRERVLLAREEGEYANDTLAALRRLARDTEDSKVEYLEGRAELAEDQVTLQGLELVYQRSRALAAKNLIAPDRLDRDRIAFAAMKSRVDKGTELVMEMKVRHAAMAERYRSYQKRVSLPKRDARELLSPFDFAIKVQQVRIDQLNLQLTRQVLRAPVGGKVAEIYRRNGEVVAAGEPVVKITEPTAREVVVYLPEGFQSVLRPGMTVRLRRMETPKVLIDARLSTLGVGLEPLPDRLDPQALVRQWGLPARLAIPRSLRVRPGESFEVNIPVPARSTKVAILRAGQPENPR